MKVGDLVIVNTALPETREEGVGVLFQDGFNLMILWPDGFIENSCIYFEHELEVVSESR
jgi:hypothetical protein